MSMVPLKFGNLATGEGCQENSAVKEKASEKFEYSSHAHYFQSVPFIQGCTLTLKYAHIHLKSVTIIQL